LLKKNQLHLVLTIYKILHLLTIFNMKKHLLNGVLAAFLAMSGFTSKAQVTVLNENFNGTGLPTGWTQVSNATDGGWLTGTNTALQSSAWSIPAFDGRMVATNDDKCNCNKADEDLFTPVMDLSALSNAFLTFDVFFGKGTYQGATEFAQVRISNDGGTTWSLLKELTGQSTWRNELIDITNYISTDVQIGFRYNDGSGWTFGCALDNIKVYEAYEYDVTTLSLDINQFNLVNTPQPISGRLRNLGAQTITSLTLNYSVNNGTPVTANLTGLNITATSYYDYTHATDWTPTSAGPYTIKVWATNLNGNADQFTANDEVSVAVIASNQVAQRKVLYEQFTSNTCTPCASSAPTIKNFLNSNGVNTPSGKMVAIKYHQNFPAPGTDAAYTAEMGSRRTFYGITGIPAAVASGNAYNGHSAFLTQAIVDRVYSQPTFLNIDLDYTYDITAKSINITVDLNPLYSYGSATKLHVVVIEDDVPNTKLPGGTTSQTEFYHIARKMLPNQNGTNIASFTAGQARNFTFTHTFDNIFNTMSGLSVVAFVQNSTTNEVFQVTSLSKDATSSQSDIYGAKNIKIYPNPMSTYSNVEFDVDGVQNINVQVMNSIGQLVESFDLNGVSGKYIHTLNTEKLENGIYILSTRMNGEVSNKKFVVSK
jgi:hypothetical protein